MSGSRMVVLAFAALLASSPAGAGDVRWGPVRIGYQAGLGGYGFADYDKAYRAVAMARVPGYESYLRSRGLVVRGRAFDYDKAPTQSIRMGDVLEAVVMVRDRVGVGLKFQSIVLPDVEYRLVVDSTSNGYVKEYGQWSPIAFALMAGARLEGGHDGPGEVTWYGSAWAGALMLAMSGSVRGTYYTNAGGQDLWNASWDLRGWSPAGDVTAGLDLWLARWLALSASGGFSAASVRSVSFAGAVEGFPLQGGVAKGGSTLVLPGGGKPSFAISGWHAFGGLTFSIGKPRRPAAVPVPAGAEPVRRAPPLTERPPAERTNIAVAGLEPQGVSASDAGVISDLLRSELVKTKAFNVVEKQNMDKILAEQGFQQTGCTSTECAVRLGRVLNVRTMVVGSFGKLMGKHFIAVRVIDVETGNAVYSDDARGDTVEDVIAGIRRIAASMAAEVR